MANVIDMRQAQRRGVSGPGGKHVYFSTSPRVPKQKGRPNRRMSVKTLEKDKLTSGFGEMTWRPQRDDLLTEDLKEKLRPVLDHRMPTLVTKRSVERSFTQISGPNQNPSRISVLQQSPPRNMKDVRMTVDKEIKILTRKLLKIEKAYYGGLGNVNNEVEKYVGSIKSMMKSMMIFDLNKTSAIDELIKLASNASQFPEEQKYLPDLKEIYAKVLTFFPGKMSDVIESCQSLLNLVSTYCVSFYEPGSDCYLETADHYSEQIKTWKERAEISIQSAKSLSKLFKTSGITMKMLSSPVAAFCSRNGLHRVLFVVLLADACTHLRNALEAVKFWVRADENYSTFIRNDVEKLENLREEKVRNLSEHRQKFHCLTFKLAQYETDHARLSSELRALREKEGVLRIEEVHLVNQSTEIQREIGHKRRQREQLKFMKANHDSDQGEELLSQVSETLKSVAKEIKFDEDRLTAVLKQVDMLKYKLGLVDEKGNSLRKKLEDMAGVQKELGQVHVDRDRKEKEYSEVVQTLDVARRVLICKTASDSVEKLYYSVPVAAKANKIVKSNDAMTVKDPVDRACRIIANKVDKDWINLYRNLPFHPHRGSERIGQDIAGLDDGGSSDASVLVARQSLKKWRRYHTRASVEDLRQALMKIKRNDIIKIIDREIQTTPRAITEAPFEAVEEEGPAVEPHLIPFYKQIERYDELKAARKAAEIEAANKKAARAKALAAKLQAAQTQS